MFSCTAQILTLNEVNIVLREYHDCSFAVLPCLQPNREKGSSTVQPISWCPCTPWSHPCAPFSIWYFQSQGLMTIPGTTLLGSKSISGATPSWAQLPNFHGVVLIVYINTDSLISVDWPYTLGCPLTWPFAKDRISVACGGTIALVVYLSDILIFTLLLTLFHLVGSSTILQVLSVSHFLALVEDCASPKPNLTYTKSFLWTTEIGDVVVSFGTPAWPPLLSRNLNP
jgi:hypothetical protein